MSLLHSTIEPRGAAAWRREGRALAGDRADAPAASRTLIASLLVLLACRLVAANAIIPPWQGPDEPAHFALTRQLTRPDGRTDLAIREFEREILASLARHGWWRYYQEPTPDPIPQAFSEVPEHLSHGTLDQPAYYLAAAAILRQMPGADIEQQYFALRTFSLLLTILTIAFGWLGTRALFGSAVAAGALAVVVLHPQFLLSAVSVNPDALINVCGALIWWQVARLRTSADRLVPCLVIAGAAVVAALSKRNGLPLGIIAAVGGAMAAGMSLRRALLVAAACIVAAAVAIAVVLSSDAYADQARRLLTYWGSVFFTGRFDVSPDRIGKFTAAAFDTSWLVAGWLRFPPPALWAWTARALTIAGAAGVIAAWRSGHGSRALALAMLFVGVHIGGLLAVTFIAGSAPQGRYLFAVMFPAAALLWSGLMYWLDRPRREWAVAAAIGLLAVLDFTGFLFVLLPAYAQ